MAATFSWNQGTGASGTTDLGASGQLWAYRNNDTTGTATYTTNPITAGSNSYEVWVRAHFTGAYNSIQNILFWGASTSPATNMSMYATTSTYVTPATSTNLTGATVMKTAVGEALTVTNTGLTSGTNSYSGWVVIQLRTATNAAAGDVATGGMAATIQYDES